MDETSVNTVWIGDAESGKTSLLTSYTQDIFPQEYVPTVYENYTAKVPLNGTGKTINLNIRATAGEEEIDPQTDVVIVVCSVGSPKDFENAKTKWIPKAQKELPGKPVILVGTKTDLRRTKEDYTTITITYKEAAKLAKETGVRKYLECSAKEINTVKTVFGEVLQEYFKNDEKTRRKAAQSRSISFRSEKAELVERVRAGHPVQDGALFEELEEKGVPGDEEFFRKCLTGRLPKTAKLIISKDYNQPDRILSGPEKPSIIFEVEEEEVIIEIMKTYKKESWKNQSQIPKTQENLLHYFVRKRFERALSNILEMETFSEVLALCFQKNSADKIPLMTVLSQGMQDSAMKLWNFMEKHETNKKLEEALSMTDTRKENIFYVCSFFSQNKLFSSMCESKKLSKKCIQDGIVQPNLDRRTALDLVTDEDTALEILKDFDHTANKLTWRDREDKNIFHHYARKNFSRAIQQLIKKLPPVEVRDMILQKSSTSGNNVLMASAVHGGSKTLELLLCFVSYFEMFQVGNETIDLDPILHDANNQGNTLLSLVLQHKESLQIPKTVLLGMEKEFHSTKTDKDNEKDLTRCFHKNLNSSDDVLRAIEEVKRSNKKGTAAIIWIWTQGFLKTFLIPVGIMTFDILTDVFLVREYFYTDQDCLTAQWIGCHSVPNQTSFEAPCGPNAKARVPRGDGKGFLCVPNQACNVPNVSDAVGFDNLNIFCIPLKLDATPRFRYSLGFIIWPWLCYLVEFLQSDIFRTMNQEMIRTWYGASTTFKQKLTQTMSAMLSSTYHILFWPIEMHRKKFLSETRYLTSYGVDRVEARLESENESIVSGRSQMIEVCTESSFQPLLQLYLFLPTLLLTFRTLGQKVSFDQSTKEFFSNVSHLQFWSIFSSCLSLAWSFTFYQSLKKRGALDFGVNALGRILLLLANVLQISSRLVCFVLFAYSWGAGNIWPAFFFVLLHIIVMSIFHTYKDIKRCQLNWTAVFQGLLNGIGNLYMYNLILPLPSEEKKKQLIKSNKHTFNDQLIVDVLFAVENMAIIVIASVCLNVDDVWSLLVFVFAGQLGGLLLKGLYYRFFHIWSLILSKKVIEV